MTLERCTPVLRSTTCVPTWAGNRRSQTTWARPRMPTAEELRLIRDELDPAGIYTK